MSSTEAMKISPKTTILTGVYHCAKTLSRRFTLKILLCSTLLAAGSASAALPELGHSGADDAQLAQLGREAMRSASRRNPTLDDVELHDYLSSLINTLRSANGLQARSVSLTLFADQSVNAFALPGGYIGVFAGLMLNAQNESALVSVLAHELAHLSQRHIFRFVQRQNQASLAAMAAVVAAALVMRENADAAQATLYSGLATANQSLLDYSRQHEREADRAGQRFMSAAGFRPAGMAEMFEGLAVKEQLNQGDGLEYLQTHPVTQSRIADAWESARQFEQTGKDDDAAFSLQKARVAALVGAPTTGPARPYAVALKALIQGEPTRARQALGTLDKTLSEQRTARLLNARIFAAAGEQGEAVRILEELQTDFPSWYPAFHAQADVLSQDGKASEAAALLLDFQRNHPNMWPLSYQVLSVHYAQAGEDLQALRWRAEHHLYNQDYVAAASLFQQALDLADADSAIAVRLQSKLDHTQERALQERPPQ